MSQASLFGPEQAPDAKQSHDLPVRMRVLITVKAAPNPSAAYGETVCVAGLRMDLDAPGWVRLYPISFRDLDAGVQFAKYDIVSINARPARVDPRIESWRPAVDSLEKEDWLRPWTRRRTIVEPYIEDSMCGVLQAVRDNPPAKSLALIRPKEVLGVDIEPHPGWTVDEQAKIDAYVRQIDMFGTDRTPLDAPRFKGWYRYRCHEPACRTHRQGILDWEFVALQRHIPGGPADVAAALKTKYLDICSSDNYVAFYVGNQAKRQQTFSVLGVYYPKR
ncbi:hypothetical protein BLA60_16905 [Actinophytocola xinjiangensis]|uniref:Uncharacterized protein n=1 Tax=Actinophytocola xinjiangensis TaxID=485602 RepID=A0A7Z1AY62_9PSEU|nr:hypothetical protein [Actinophytocola xinjiangensis]OLF10130.1 hypothetical protein BLA60_16905 [Actinophytocola xinjiangensis]